MTHYVCPGTCRSVSKRPAACVDENCPWYAKPMVRCDCPDGGHREALKKLEEEEREEELE